MTDKLKLLWMVPLLTLFASCTDKMWDEHYQSYVDEILDQTLMDAINERPELSIFSGMLKSTGYDSILSRSQSYTVWAPVNASLTNLKYSDDELKTFVENHITRYPLTCTSITEDDKPVSMLNHKKIRFSRSGPGYTFGQQTVIENDITVNNGILQVLDHYEPYVRNIWEFLQYTPGFENYFRFLNSYEEYEFNEAASTFLTFDENGQSVYDSIFWYNNGLLSDIGSFKDEDSSYTLLAPKNAAWDEMFDSIKSYFVYSNSVIPRLETGMTIGPDYKEDNYADSMQYQSTVSVMALKMSFRGVRTPEDIAAATYMKPNICEVYNLVDEEDYIIKNPAEFFSDSRDTTVSNGVVYMADHLHFSPSDWCKTVKVEAESNSGAFTLDPAEMRARNTYSRQTRSYPWISDQISNKGFLEVVPVSSTDKAYATFFVYDLQSTAYNIYVVLVPATYYVREPEAEDSAKCLPNKMQFTLAYPTGDGLREEINYNKFTYTNDPFKVDTVLVTRDADGNPSPVTFPYCTCFEIPSVTFKVYNNVSSKETKRYSRNLLIDCVIFEPAL